MLCLLWYALLLFEPTNSDPENEIRKTNHWQHINTISDWFVIWILEYSQVNVLSGVEGNRADGCHNHQHA